MINTLMALAVAVVLMVALGFVDAAERVDR